MSRGKRFFLLPVLVALYVVHPVLGFVGLAGGFVSVYFMRRARQALTPGSIDGRTMTNTLVC